MPLVGGRDKVSCVGERGGTMGLRLLTKEIENKLQSQYTQGSSFDQLIICKIFDPCSQWTWYLMNQDPDNPDYLWAIVRGFEIEMGSVSLSELESLTNKIGLGLERDLYWESITAKEVWERLNGDGNL